MQANEENNRQFIEKISLFSGLSSADLDALAGLLRQKTYTKEQTILQRDDAGNSLFIIIEGRAKVVLFGENQREIVLSTLKAGDFFGEMALLDGAPRSAHVIAQEPVHILVLERQDFLNQVRQNPEIGLKVMEVMSKRLREADEKIGTLALLDVYGRLARYVIDLARKEGVKVDADVVIERRPTHQEIAAIIGASRETVSRGLSEFARKGFLHMDGKKIRIPQASLVDLEDRAI